MGEDVDPYASLLERLGGGDEDAGGHVVARDFAGLAAERQQAQFAQAAGQLSRLLGTRGAQAYCLECPVPMARATAAPQLTLWQRAALMAGLSR